MAESKSLTQEQAVEVLSKSLQRLPDNWVLCRDMRHAWAVENDFHIVEVEGNKNLPEIRRTLICMRCATRRNERFAHSKMYGLEKTHQSYTYPESYLIKGVPRGVKPQAVVQQEQYRRTMERIAKNAQGREVRVEESPTS